MSTFDINFVKDFLNKIKNRSSSVQNVQILTPSSLNILEGINMTI